MTDIPPEWIEKAARAIVERRGFCWVESPEDEGQDAYDICSDALDEARAALAAIWPDVVDLVQVRESAARNALEEWLWIAIYRDGLANV